MEHAEFRAASSEFTTWVNTLQSAVENYLPEVLEMLEGPNPTPMGMTREQAAELTLRDISKKITDVMATFNLMLESIEMPPFYRIPGDPQNEPL